MSGDKDNPGALDKATSDATEAGTSSRVHVSRTPAGSARVADGGADVAAHDSGIQGLLVSVRPSMIHVTLPDIQSAQHQIALVGALHRTLESAPSDADWVVDVSQVRLLPLSFAGFLLGLGEKLRSKGLGLRLAGVREGLFASGADSMAFAFSEFTSREDRERKSD
ncbi:MAG: hypothetical protein GY851_21195 [bacterium]|nr:hypothetical protein [bacterium]